MRVGPLEFAEPIWLLGLLLLVPIYSIWRTSRIPASPVRKWGMLVLRAALVVALVLSLADTRLVWSNKGICVAFVVDQSQSVPTAAREAVRNAIKAQVDKMTRDDQFVIVEFGGDTVLEALPSPRGEMPPPAKVADNAHTNLARALRLAMATFPTDKQKRIVLYSDGNQNQEDALREARIAGVKDVDVEVVPILAERGHEVMVDQVIVPPHVRKDARFMVRALVTSDSSQDVEVTVMRDGAPYRRLDKQTLKTGHNVIDVPDVISDGGGHRYEVTLVPKNTDADTFAANNTGYAITQVDAPGKVLIVPGRTNDQTTLYDALTAAGIQVVKANPGGLPGTVDELAAYDCVILDNVNHADFAATTQLAALKKWVMDYGGGLVLVGGDDSFGPGGYTGTELEDLAPVEMDVKRKKHLASLATVAILDKSGSMGMTVPPGIQKIQLAAEGACAVVKMLDPDDLAMIGVCDTEVRWADNMDKLVPMSVGNRNRVSDAIRTVRAGGGGIFCETALIHSYRLINQVDIRTMTKHVILFADSQDSDQQEGCVEMAKDMYQKFGITTTVIGMGVPTDPHAPFQKAVADAGHGRFFITEDVNNLPRLFLKDAFIVSRQAFIESKEGFGLTPYNSPLLQGFLQDGKAQLPKIYGYVGTTLKPRATLALHGKQPDDPVLAHWVIGLGKAVAYTSDSTTRWGKDWATWNGYAKFWSQVIRWVSRTSQTNGLTTNTLIEGSDGRVVVDAADGEGKPLNNLQLQASVISPDETAATSNVTLEQIAPGRYQGRFTASQRGTYMVAVSEGTAENHQLVSTGGGVLSYPPEYRDLEPNVALLKNVADASGGKYLTDAGNLFEPKPLPVKTFWPLWQMLLVVVTSALFFDIAWRRLNLADWIKPASKGMPTVTRTDASVGALKQVKSGRRDVDSQRKSMRERVAVLAQNQPAAPLPTAAPGDRMASRAEAEPESPKPTAGVPQESAENYANRLMKAKNRAKDQMREQSKE